MTAEVVISRIRWRYGTAQVKEATRYELENEDTHVDCLGITVKHGDIETSWVVTDQGALEDETVWEAHHTTRFPL